MPWIKHRGGPIEAEFSMGWAGRVLAELAYEHPKEDLAVTVLHESGWDLAVLPDGNVVLDNAEDEVSEPETAMLRDDDLIDALEAVARGDIGAVSIIIARATAND